MKAHATPVTAITRLGMRPPLTSLTGSARVAHSGGITGFITFLPMDEADTDTLTEYVKPEDFASQEAYNRFLLEGSRVTPYPRKAAWWDKPDPQPAPRDPRRFEHLLQRA